MTAHEITLRFIEEMKKPITDQQRSDMAIRRIFEIEPYKPRRKYLKEMKTRVQLI